MKKYLYFQTEFEKRRSIRSNELETPLWDGNMRFNVAFNFLTDNG